MNNQFSPMDYSLDQEYRTRQMSRSETIRQSDETDNSRPNITHSLMQANIISSVLVVASIIALIIFFGNSAGSTSAQTMFDEGANGDANSMVQMYLLAAVANIRSDDYNTATQILEEGISVEPGFAALYMSLSYIALQDDNTDDALTHAETAYLLTPNDPAAVYMLAEVNFALENYEIAQAAYELYLDMVYAQGYQPVLITTLLDGDTLPVIAAQLDACAEALATS